MRFVRGFSRCQGCAFKVAARKFGGFLKWVALVDKHSCPFPLIRETVIDELLGGFKVPLS